MVIKENFYLKSRWENKWWLRNNEGWIMTSQKELYKKTITNLKNILNCLEHKSYSDKDYMYLCKKLKQMYEKLNQNYYKLNNNYKFSAKKQKDKIKDYFPDDWNEEEDDY